MKAKNATLFVSALVMCALVFVGDLLIVRGYVEWLLYILPLLLIYLAGRTDLTYIVLGVIGILLGIGFLVSPDPGIPTIISLTDRLEGFIVFVAYSIIINLLIRSRRSVVEARKSAEEKSEELAVMNKELETFSYSVSHDLRNPLQAVDSFVDLLREEYTECLDEDGREYLRRIDNGTKKMNQLIDDMLSLSSVSRLEVDRDEINLSSMASSVLHELAHSDPQRSVMWNVQDDIRVLADPRLLNIALSNLIGNAWKYTGGTQDARIEVGADRQNDRLVCYVRDNGAGFDMSNADIIFAPFRRLHTEREFSGTGIGLATVERVIHRHGGRVWAESEIGKGATFYFTLG